MQDKDVKELGMKFRYALNLKDLLEYSRRGGGSLDKFLKQSGNPQFLFTYLGAQQSIIFSCAFCYYSYRTCSFLIDSLGRYLHSLETMKKDHRKIIVGFK